MDCRLVRSGLLLCLVTAGGPIPTAAQDPPTADQRGGQFHSTSTRRVAGGYLHTYAPIAHVAPRPSGTLDADLEVEWGAPWIEFSRWGVQVRLPCRLFHAPEGGERRPVDWFQPIQLQAGWPQGSDPPAAEELHPRARTEKAVPWIDGTWVFRLGTAGCRIQRFAISRCGWGWPWARSGAPGRCSGRTRRPSCPGPGPGSRPPSSRPSPSTSTAGDSTWWEAGEIRAAIEGLREVSEPDAGYASSMSGVRFLPVPSIRDWRGGMLGVNHGLRTNAPLTWLEEWGPKALPFLVAHLGDETPTAFELEHDGHFGGMWHQRRIAGNPSNPHERRALGHEVTAGGIGIDSFDSHLSRYRVSVGDLCFVDPESVGDNPVKTKLAEMIGHLPPTGVDPQGRGLDLLRMVGRKTPEHVRELLALYLEADTLERRPCACNFLQELSPLAAWTIEVLRPWLDDPTPTETYYAEVPGAQHPTHPVRLCDEAARVLRRLEGAPRFFLAGSPTELDARIEALRRWLDAR